MRPVSPTGVYRTHTFRTVSERSLYNSPGIWLNLNWMFLAVLLSGPMLLLQAQDEKLPIPSRLLRAAAKNEITEIYKDEYAKKDPNSRLTGAYDAVFSTVEGMTEKQLNEQRELLSRPDKPLLAKTEYLDFLKDHNTHHRAQAITYLRAKDIAPPTYRIFAFN